MAAQAAAAPTAHTAAAPTAHAAAAPTAHTAVVPAHEAKGKRLLKKIKSSEPKFF